MDEQEKGALLLLPKPCVNYKINFGDWKSMNGLAEYSGTIFLFPLLLMMYWHIL